MLGKIQEIDSNLLLFFNRLNNPVLDFLFYWASDRFIWIPLYVFIAWMLFKNFRKDFIVLLLVIAAMIAVSDQLASSILKNAVMRLRPCHNPLISAEVHLVNGYCGGMYGFVSSHAANSFALVTFLTSIIMGRNLKYALWTWAIFVSFSRIYLGAHYPGDVICGALLGCGAGLLASKSFVFYRMKFSTKKNNPRT